MLPKFIGSFLLLLAVIVASAGVHLMFVMIRLVPDPLSWQGLITDSLTSTLSILSSPVLCWVFLRVLALRWNTANFFSSRIVFLLVFLTEVYFLEIELRQIIVVFGISEIPFLSIGYFFLRVAISIVRAYIISAVVFAEVRRATKIYAESVIIPAQPQ